MVWVAGHFGEWIQGRVDGKVVLVTLCCPDKGVCATLGDAEAFALDDPHDLLGRVRAMDFLRALGHPPRGRAGLVPDLPLGVGAGMSTAALVALAQAVGAPRDRIAAACLAVEGAVDPLMLPRPDAVLWAPRAAATCAALPMPPRADILGGSWGPPVPTDPGDTGFPAVEDLVTAWAAAPALPEAARLASQSAARTSALRGPKDDPTPQMAGRLGALGWARAHTGSARALIFPPGGIPPNGETQLAMTGFENVFRFTTGGRS